jgi:hypothetical protein
MGAQQVPVGRSESPAAARLARKRRERGPIRNQADVGATAETALYNGGSLWARYWAQTVIELRPRLVTSGKLDDRSIGTFLAHCADPAWWTQTIAFTAVDGRVLAAG